MQIGGDGMGFAQMGAVGGWQIAGFFGERVQGELGGPGEGEDVMGEEAQGMEGLAELSISDTGGAAEGIEERLGALGRSGAVGLGPEGGPPLEVGAGFFWDAEGVEALEERSGEG